MVAASFVVSVGVYIDLLGMSAEERSHVEVIFSWIPVGALQVDMAFLADPLSIIMCLFVTGIGALIHLYSIGYMHGDPKFSKFFLYLNLFVVRHDAAGARREHAGHVPRLGGRRHLLVLPDRLLAHPRIGGHGRQEGLRHQPRR